jgi:hypothetical protein
MFVADLFKSQCRLEGENLLLRCRKEVGEAQLCSCERSKIERKLDASGPVLIAPQGIQLLRTRSVEQN